MTQTIRLGEPQFEKTSRLPIVFGILVTLAIVGWWVLYQSRWFIIEDITISGTKRVSTQSVLQSAQVKIGQPLMAADPQDITDRLLTLPAVRTATVTRSWPHDLLIQITERQPIAAVPQGKRFFLVDSQGYVAGIVKKLANNEPIIYAKPETPAIKAALDVRAALPRKWKVSNVAAKSDESVVVNLRNGMWIKFGSAQDADYKIQVASALLARGYGHINVSSPDTPTAIP
mgnify:CR=1 FL=1